MARKSTKPPKHPAQAQEIEAVMKALGLGLNDKGFELLAHRIAVKPETVRKAAKGYQKASDQLMNSIRQVATLDRMFRPTPSTEDTNAIALREEVKPFLNFNGTKRVPIVSFARAGEDSFNYDDLARYIDETVETDCKDPNCFALIVEGDSMEPKFSPGDMVVVAPNVEPNNGDLVIARLRESGGVLFKRYHLTDSGRRVKLTSYNAEQYPALEFDRGEFRFIYPVYSMTRRLRR